MKRKAGIFLVSTILFLAGLARVGFCEEKWFVALYRARLTSASFPDTVLFRADYPNAHLTALALGRKMGTWKELVGIELETQAVKHDGDQDHMEFNALFALRWLPFPWDRYLETSFAVGEGLSYATKSPAVEAKDTKLLNYMMFELSFALPSVQRWQLIARLHHRSGILGMFNGVNDASNALGLGIRYLF